MSSKLKENTSTMDTIICHSLLAWIITNFFFNFHFISLKSASVKYPMAAHLDETVFQG